MRENDLAMLALIEGCLPDEFVVRVCNRCKKWFETEAKEKVTCCPDCRKEVTAWKAVLKPDEKLDQPWFVEHDQSYRIKK